MANTARAQRRLSGLSGRASLVTITLLIVVGGAAALFLGGRTPFFAGVLPVNHAKSISSVSAPGVAGGPTLSAGSALAAAETEAQLVKTLAEIKNQRMDNALTEIDKIIAAHPNFRLAHLIKGDLLYAKSGAIKTIGGGSEAPQELLDEMRDEARARATRYLSDRPKDLVPRYLVQMLPRERHALVVDTAKATLYVFENKDGEARYVTDYYVSIGKQGMDKFREGDNKTPLGVYHVTGSISRQVLSQRYGAEAEQYGAGALPINYPNDWDRRAGRNGHGIWLHGVPFDTYSRPPRASNGCVALNNEDFAALAKRVAAEATPVIIAHGVDWASPNDVRALRSDLNKAFETWRSDWESLNTTNYLSHYSKQFSSANYNYKTWADYKRAVNAGKTWIKVKVDNVSMFYYPGQGEGDMAMVTFNQYYSSSNLNGTTKRRQYWKKENGAWKIIYEGMAPV